MVHECPEKYFPFILSLSLVKFTNKYQIKYFFSAKKSEEGAENEQCA